MRSHAESWLLGLSFRERSGLISRPRLYFRLLPSPLPGGSALFCRVLPMTDLATSCWKAHSWLVQMFMKMMVHFYWYAGIRAVSDARKPPRFCLECRSRGCANPALVLLAAFSRLLSGCYPLSYRLPLLHWLCADETCSTQ